VQKSCINLDEHFDEDGRLQYIATLEGLAADDRQSMNYNEALDGSSMTFVIVTAAAEAAFDATRAISLFEDLQPRRVTVTYSLTASRSIGSAL